MHSHRRTPTYHLGDVGPKPNFPSLILSTSKVKVVLEPTSVLLWVLDEIIRTNSSHDMGSHDISTILMSSIHNITIKMEQWVSVGLGSLVATCGASKCKWVLTAGRFTLICIFSRAMSTQIFCFFQYFSLCPTSLIEVAFSPILCENTYTDLFCLISSFQSTF